MSADEETKSEIRSTQSETHRISDFVVRRSTGRNFSAVHGDPPGERLQEQSFGRMKDEGGRMKARHPKFILHPFAFILNY
ncbi:MAG: hypothetical protein ACREIV_10675 [Planctomycetaceae bacterium]